MIDYGLFRFAAAPRTGTTWVLKAASLAGLGDGFKSRVHEPHPVRHGASLAVSLVRRPTAWLASYYRAIRGGSTGVACVDQFAQLDFRSFERFVVSYLRTFPGQIGRMIDAYNADVYMRIEDMPWGFAELLESLNVPRQMRQRFYDLGRQNVSRGHVAWPRGMRRRVEKAEQDLMERFEYY